VARGLSACFRFVLCPSSSFKFTRRSFELLGICCREFVGPSAGGPDRPRGVHGQSAIVGPSVDQAPIVRFSGCGSGGSVAVFRLSTRGSRTVRRVSADRPSYPCGLSAWCFTGLLSPLLLELCFHLGIDWGLFLGLVGPL
jgi:hypothetical protein